MSINNKYSNNYGPWNNEEEAKELVIKAISEVCYEGKGTTGRIKSLILTYNKKVKEIVKDMSEV